MLENYETISKEEYDSKLNLIGDYNNQLQASFSSHNTDKSADIQSIINNLPSRNNTTSGYYANAYEQALNLIGDNPIDIQKLNSLAYMCPIEAGEAVYLARQILKTLGDNNFYDDILACNREDSAPRSLEETVEKDIADVYPNPSTGIINFNSEDDVIAALVAGATNNFEKINVNENSIDLSSFPSEMYILKLKMGSGNIHFKKIILVK